jgi:WD40 repeat protein
VLSAAMGVDGPQAVSCGEDGTLRVWRSDVVPHQIAHFGRGGQGREHDKGHTNGHAGPATRCHLTPDCLRAISVGKDGRLNVWRLVSGHEDAVTDVVMSHDGTKVVTCSVDKRVRVWDSISGTQLMVLGTHTQCVSSVSLSPILLEDPVLSANEVAKKGLGKLKNMHHARPVLKAGKETY